MFGGGETSLGGRGGAKMEKTRKRKLWLDGCKLSRKNRFSENTIK